MAFKYMFFYLKNTILIENILIDVNIITDVMFDEFI